MLWCNRLGAWVIKISTTSATIELSFPFYYVSGYVFWVYLEFSWYKSSGLNMSMVLYSCRSWIQILEMLNKSLLHIIFNKWIFIDLMSNLMAICVTCKVRSWNFVHIMNPFAPIPWNSSNNISILLIQFGFIIFHFDSHRYTFCYCWSCFW